MGLETVSADVPARHVALPGVTRPAYEDLTTVVPGDGALVVEEHTLYLMDTGEVLASYFKLCIWHFESGWTEFSFARAILDMPDATDEEIESFLVATYGMSALELTDFYFSSFALGEVNLGVARRYFTPAAWTASTEAPVGSLTVSANIPSVVVPQGGRFAALSTTGSRLDFSGGTAVTGTNSIEFSGTEARINGVSVALPTGTAVPIRPFSVGFFNDASLESCDFDLQAGTYTWLMYKIAGSEPVIEAKRDTVRRRFA